MDTLLEFGYTNYKGEYAVRRVVPQHIYFGHTEYHPANQWLMHAFDVDKGEFRDFAMADMRLDCPHCKAVAKEAKEQHDPYRGRS